MSHVYNHDQAHGLKCLSSTKCMQVLCTFCCRLLYADHPQGLRTIEFQSYISAHSASLTDITWSDCSTALRIRSKFSPKNEWASAICLPTMKLHYAAITCYQKMVQRLPILIELHQDHCKLHSTLKGQQMTQAYAKMDCSRHTCLIWQTVTTTNQKIIQNCGSNQYKIQIQVPIKL